MMSARYGALAAWLNAAPLRQRAVAYLGRLAERVYLVGGSVRDALLGRDGYDLDVAVDGNAMILARRLADEVGGAYVPLDEAHDVARVVVRAGGLYHHIDLAGLRAPDILRDLQARDFTINAMAVALGPTLGPLLDPTGGESDLAAHILRAAYRDAFRDDPLRILRGLRLSEALSLHWTAETEALARAALPALPQASGERIRDELFNVLSLPHSGAAWESALAYEAWSAVLPLADAASFRRAVILLKGLDAHWPYCGDPLSPWRSLEPLRAPVTGYWQDELSVGRNRHAILKLATLLAGTDGAALAVRQGAHLLKLSRRESHHLEATAQLAAHPLWHDGQSEPTPLTIYRYYHAAGDAGVNAAFLALCRASALDSEAAAEMTIARAETVLRAWFEKRAVWIDPRPLLSGREISEVFGVAPGPRLGALLEALREAQVSGQVESVEQAKGYVGRLLAGAR